MTWDAIPPFRLLYIVLTLIGAGSAAEAATLSGQITAAAVKAEPINMAADEKCVALNAGQPALKDDLVVGKDGGVQNVLVYVKEGLKPETRAAQTPDPQQKILDQRGCRYVPKVTAVRVGQPLVIRNSDSLAHNIRAKSARNGGFNINTPRVMTLPKPAVFAKPELGIKIKCDIHTWMSATVHVFDHPFFAITDEAGKFEITGLPAGTYTLEARHENVKLGTKTLKVTVKEGAPTVANISYNARSH